MARKEILVSDISGSEVAPESAAKVTVVLANGDRYELDVSEDEVSNLTEAGRKVRRRGRPPKVVAAA